MTTQTDRAVIGAFADLLPPRAPSLAELAMSLIAASDALRTAYDADWDKANERHYEAQAAFRRELESITKLPLPTLQRAMGEI